MDVHLTSDEEFINRLTIVVKKHISDEKFGVKQLASEVHMSREQIYRKLKNINNQSVSQFIREVRLSKAKEMLYNDEGTVSEIAYNVGFSSPSYFVKCFRESLGYPPGEFKKHNPGKTPIESIKEIRTSQKRAFSKWYIPALVLIIILNILIYYAKKAPSNTEKTIAVLPFKNFSNNPENQYLADGIMEDILNFLFWVGDLKVTSRTSTEQFRDSQHTTKEIAKALKVNYILEGSFRKQDSTVRICAQLIDAHNDKHIWSEIYDRNCSDMLGVQNEIALKVAQKLKAILSKEEIQQINKLPTSNQQAYNAYLKAQFLLNKTNSHQRIDVDGDAMYTSIKYFKKAIELDSLFVQAYVGLANAYSGLSGWGFAPGSGGWKKADTIIEKVLMIDPLLGEAHAMKGAIHFWGGARNYDAALVEFEKALQLNPNYPPLYQWYAQLLMITGPIEDARKYVDIALDIEPYYWVTHNLSAYIYYFEEKYNESLKDCQMAKDLYKDYIFNNWLFFLNYIKLNEGEKATKELQTILAANPETESFAKQIPVIYSSGGTKALVKWIAEAQANSPVSVKGIGRSPYIIAWWYGILGDKENCLKWLEQCTIHSFGYNTSLAVSNPDFDFVRDDPRFIRFLERIGVAQYHVRSPHKPS